MRTDIHIFKNKRSRFKDSKFNRQSIQNKQDYDRNMQKHTCKMKNDNYIPYINIIQDFNSTMRIIITETLA